MLAAKRVRPSKKAKSTPSSRRHRFESFSQRIANLNIDPVRKVRQTASNDASDPTTSYFHNGLLHWKDLNLSETFTDFVQEVEPLCNSLPQILHYESSIVEILHRYLDKRDALALEPLLSLTSQLSHDLGARFEQYFPSTLTLILSIAAKHSNVEVTEWSFSCLAWLFKYLSRLLTPDVRPTYDIMAMALGKENHKPFIARFAAESLSFLVRKAAASYQKDGTPLQRIVAHVCQDLMSADLSEKNESTYMYGVMNLFASAIKGVDHAFHASGPTIYQCLLENVSGLKGLELISGITINLVHHANEVSLTPILNVLYQQVAATNIDSDRFRIQNCAQLLYNVSAVRKGSRVSDWEPLLSSIKHLLCVLDTSSRTVTEHEGTVISKALAVALQSAPLQVVIPYFRLVESLSSQLPDGAFVAFCIYFSDLGRERYEKFISQSFYQYLASNWNKLEKELLHGIRCNTVATEYALISNKNSQKHAIPQAWQERISGAFDNNRPVSTSLQLAYVEILGLLDHRPSIEEQALSNLRKRLQGALESKSLDLNDENKLVFGRGLRFLLWNSEASKTIHLAQLNRKSSILGCMPSFLENICILLDQTQVDVADDSLDVLFRTLIENLTSPSKDLRIVSLRAFDKLYYRRYNQKPEILSIALAIEALPVEVQAARVGSMHLRRLSETYKAASSDIWLAKAVPAFCFGVLHMNIAQLWADAVETLKIVSTFAAGEEVISKLAFRWLASESKSRLGEEIDKQNTARLRVNEFECSHLAKIEQIISHRVKEIESAGTHLQLEFDRVHYVAPRMNENCRSQALRVLKGIPELAEKKSRHLIPIFFQYMPKQSTADFSLSDNHEKDTESLETSFSRRDQKSMLDLFGSFVNPRVLYRSSEVYDALLNTLANGDAGVQAAALKGILTWKNKELENHAESLSNLLDDARFRDEVAVFIKVDEDGNVASLLNQVELLPVLLRILYGRIISRQGASSTKGSLVVKRRAVFNALMMLPDPIIRDFLNIALGPLKHLRVENNEIDFGSASPANLPKARQQLGLLHLLEDMIDVMGDRLTFLTQPILNAILYCSDNTFYDVSRPVENEASDGLPGSNPKESRKIAARCLDLMVNHFASTSLKDYIPAIFRIIISPRIHNFAAENSQSVSSTLQLISIWASSNTTVFYLVDYVKGLIEVLTDILTLTYATDQVKLFVLDQVLKRVASLIEAESDGNIRHRVLEPNEEFILERISKLLMASPSKQVLGSALDFLSILSRSVQDSTHIQTWMDLLSFLLSQPANRLNPKSKGDILVILESFIPMSGLVSSTELFDKLLHSLLPLFSYFKDRENRVKLAQVLRKVAQIDVELYQVSVLCEALDSFMPGSIDEPDFDQRLQAFHTIETEGHSYSAKQWEPLLYSMLYHIQNTEELAIRTSASHGLKGFLKANVASTNSQSSPHPHIRHILLPALRDGAAHKSELVRIEFMSVLAELVRSHREWDEVNDLAVLLMNDDEEASFFTNILHVQQHRRLRALRRLTAVAQTAFIQSRNVAHFLIPLLEHFVLNKAEDSAAHNLTAETVTTLGALAMRMEWPQFRAMFRRYTGYVTGKPEIEKPAIRLLSMMADTLDQATSAKSNLISEVSETMQILESDDNKNCVQLSTLTRTLPRSDKISQDLRDALILPLQGYIQHKDESTVSQRVPVAITVVKLLQLLPTEQFVQRLPPVLTAICQILRSRSQESRDLARKTLVDISAIIGPTYFGFILKELRSSLPRGYQLHVLSFTAHSLLLANEPSISTGDLDYCLADITTIILDDMFGATGQEKDAEDYVSKMKEVKSNKSYDTMEIVTRKASLSHIYKLIGPMRALLEEKLDLRMSRKVDELFRRMGVGLLHNEAINSQESLVLCYELLQQAFSTRNENDSANSGDKRVQRYLVNLKAHRKTFTSFSPTSAFYKLAKFAFDLVRTVFTRYDDLRTPSNLVGFMPMIGDALLGAHEEVQTSVVRLLAATIQVPLDDLDKNAPVYLDQGVKIIKNATSTSSEAAQAALKLITSILKQRPNVTMKDTDIGYLLKRIKSDLEEPDRQGVTFNFIKAVLHRQVLITEVYEILDSIAAILITNQAKGARDMARGLYLQFLLNYPQSKVRLKKQIAFLVKNLNYSSFEGRQSVLETMHLLLGKVKDNTLQQMVGAFFAPLIIVTANDDSADCRRMAGMLLKVLFEKADSERLSSMTSSLRAWLDLDDQLLLIRVSLQGFGLYMEVDPSKVRRELPLLQARSIDILESSLQDISSAEWEIVYAVLQLLAKTTQTYPEIILQADKSSMWELIQRCSGFPHAWVKLASAKLLGQFFADFARTNSEQNNLSLPLLGSHGLRLELDKMAGVMKTSFRVLKVTAISEELAAQLVRNLVFLGRLLGSTSQSTVVGNDQDEWNGMEDEGIDAEHDGDENSEEQTDQEQSPLGYMFGRISAILRREPVTARAPSLTSKTASIQLLAALCSHLSVESVSTHLFAIILPLHHLTDASVTTPFSIDEDFKAAQESIVSRAQEILSLLQKKLGTSQFVKVLAEVRDQVNEKRGERKAKRKIEAVADPERAGLKRTKKRIQQRAQRKERNVVHRSQRRGW